MGRLDGKVTVVMGLVVASVKQLRNSLQPRVLG